MSIYFELGITAYFNCQSCFELFKCTDVENMLTHSKSCSHMTRMSVYGCLLCDYHTDGSYRMKRHFAIHREEKPFKCLYCHLSYSRKDHMNRHIRQKH